MTEHDTQNRYTESATRWWLAEALVQIFVVMLYLSLLFAVSAQHSLFLAAVTGYLGMFLLLLERCAE